MQNIPTQIYLNVFGAEADDDFKDLSEATWSTDRQSDADPRFISEEHLIEGLRLLENKIAAVEQTRHFCHEHNFGMEVAHLDMVRSILGSVRSSLRAHFDLLGVSIEPNK